MSRWAQSCPSVWPLSARRRSSNCRRLASASALKTLSISASTALLCNLVVACQGRFHTPSGIHAVPALWCGDAQACSILLADDPRGGVLVVPGRVGDLFAHAIDEPRNRRFAAPSLSLFAASLEWPFTGGGGSRRTASRPPFLGGDHEGDPFGNVGTWALRLCGRAGRQGEPGRDVEVRI